MADKPFADRSEAGRLLAGQVALLSPSRPIVLALPRGGVPVAAEVAAALGAELDVIVARKLGAPSQPELGLGALAEGGEPWLDPRLLAELGLRREDMGAVIAAERAELARRVRAYRGERPLPQLAGRDVVLVDDGLATGGTARAALRALRLAGVRRVILAVPVAAPQALQALAAEADDLVVLRTPTNFRAVGRWYRRFPQLDDTTVIALLAAANVER